MTYTEAIKKGSKINKRLDNFYFVGTVVKCLIPGSASNCNFKTRKNFMYKGNTGVITSIDGYYVEIYDKKMNLWYHRYNRYSNAFEILHLDYSPNILLKIL